MKRSRFDMFTKDPDVPPFFSVHPKTVVGTVLRVALIVFVALASLIVFLASRGLMFVWLYKLYYLLYLVPGFIVAALVVLALFKRMRSLIGKIAVPGLLGFLVLSLFMTLISTMSAVYDLGITPKSFASVDGRSIVFLRTCDPHEELGEDGLPLYHYTLKSNRYTVRVPQAAEGVSYTIEGEIFVPEGAEYAITPEWLSEDQLHYAITKDNSSLAHGEITVTFSAGETTPASPEATETMKYLSKQENAAHTVYFYSEPAYENFTTNTFMALAEERVDQLYTAAPAVMRLFARSTTRVEGIIRLEPYSDLRVTYEWKEDDVLTIRPAEECTGATGEITIYFGQTIDPTAENT